MGKNSNRPSGRNQKKLSRNARRNLRLKERKKNRREAARFRQKLESDLLQEDPQAALAEDLAEFAPVESAAPAPRERGPHAQSKSFKNRDERRPHRGSQESGGSGRYSDRSSSNRPHGGREQSSRDHSSREHSGRGSRREKPKVLHFGSSRVVVGGDSKGGRPNIKAGSSRENFRWKRPQVSAPQPHHPLRRESDRVEQPQAPLRKSKGSDELIAGRLDLHPDGFGFLIPQNGEIDNIYLPEETLKYCMHRDQILVRREESRNANFKARGILVSIVKRAQSEIVGTLRAYRGGALVIPLEARDRRHAFKAENYANSEFKDLKSGATVIAKVTRCPEVSGGSVELVSEMKEPSAAHNDTMRILLSTGWPRLFSSPALKEAETRADRWKEHWHAKRRDMKDAPFVTIDGRDARDFDDAVCATHEGKNIRLWVAIADVSHFVKPGSPLDVEAFERSTSVYFPDHVVPMLPEILSNGLCSLNPFEDRLSLVCEMVIDHAGICQWYEFYEAVICSKRRMTYEEMQSFIEKDAWSEQELRPLAHSLSPLVECYERLKRARFTRGAIDLDLPEAYVHLNPDGTVRDIQTRTRLDAHRLIEECMLIANDSAARFIQSKFPEGGMYRIHEQPDERKISDLMKFLMLSGIDPLKFLGAKRKDRPKKGGKGKSQNGESSGAELLNHPKDFNRLLENLKTEFEPGDPLARAIQMLILRTQKQARYSSDPLGHFALATEDYTHFTSPIRRYPDLVVHRLIKAGLGVEHGREKLERELESQARHASDQERLAMEMERKVVDLKKCRYMEPHLGEEFEAFVQGVTEKGIFCQIDGHFVEGLVSSEQLGRGFRLHFDPDIMAYAGAGKRFLRIGSRVKVQLVAVDLETRRIDFELLEVLTKSV